MEPRPRLPFSWPVRLGVLALAGIVTAGAVWWSTQPAPVPQVVASSAAPPRVPIIVTAAHAGGPTVSSGIPTTVTAHALAAGPISALELWSATGRVAVHHAERTSQALYASWQWTPEESGDALLFARAIDAGGRVAQSNVIRLAVRDPGSVPLTGAAPRIVLAADEPEPVFAFAPPEATGQLADCSLELTVADVPATASGLALYQLAPASATFTPIASLGTDDGPVTIGAPVGPGTYLFAVSAFDADAEVYSGPIMLEAPPECATSGWSGSAQLIGGELVIEPAVAVDSAYLYARVDDGVAVRIPSDPAEFILPAADGTLLAAPHLPPMTGNVLDIEAWGWVGGELIELGTGTWTAPPEPKASIGGSEVDLTASPYFPSWPLPANVTTLRYKTPNQFNPSEDGVILEGGEFGYKLLTEGSIASYPDGTYGSTTFNFRWTTQLPGVTAVVWQILPYAPSPSSDLTPPFLVDAETWLVAPGTTTGDFSINFAPYLPGPDGTVDIDAEEAKQSAAESLSQVLVGPPAFPQPPNANDAPGDPVAMAGALALDLSTASLGGEQEVPGLPVSFGNTSFHVRIIPLQGISAGIASNGVSFDVVATEQVELSGVPTQLPPPEVEFEFTPPIPAVAGFSRCAVVKELTDAFEMPPQGSFWHPWAKAYQEAAGDPSKFFCYTPDDDDDGGLLGAFQAFVEFVADVVDFVATAYEDIKAAIVSVLAAPCGLIGIDQGTCDVVAEAALTAVLVAAGIPPSIPNFKVVVEGMKGDLANAVVSLASELPVVATACDSAATASEASEVPTCQELAAEAIA
jgi:hypothetical protein